MSVTRRFGRVGLALVVFVLAGADAPRRPSFSFPAGELSIQVRPPEAPMSLTASDGTGLRLTRLVGRAVVEEPLAFTELRLAFENPQDREIEGHFRITLPQGATLSRFAMRLGDRWQEGEVVEKQAARRAYEDFLHRRQDPALLEQAAGNEFSARVFPIPARGTKELIVSYSQELVRTGDAYVMPLRGLPELGELDFAVVQAGAPAQVLKRTRFVPNADFVFAPKPVAGRSGLRHRDLAVARVKPFSSVEPDEIESLIVLVDTSASRALGFNEQVRLLERLVDGLAKGGGSEAPLTVACFDQAVELVFEGRAADFGARQLAAIKARRPLGASNLQSALAWAQQRAARKPARRLLLLTDGVATAGATEGDELLAATSRLKSSGIERLDALAMGGIRDDALMRRLVTAGLKRDGIVLDGTTTALSEIGRRLTQATRSDLKVEVAEASWYWPRKLDGIQPGDEVLIYAELPAGRPLQVSIDGKSVQVGELVGVERPLLERSWAQARIASLLHKRDIEADGPAQKAVIEKEIINLSVTHRVLSPMTALLVLETEQDYARFGIDRRALADVLTVDEKGRLALLKRGADSIPVVAGRPQPQDLPSKPMKKAERGRDEISEAGVAGSPADAPTTAAPQLDSLAAPVEEETAEAESLAPPAAAPSGAPSRAPAEEARVEREMATSDVAVDQRAQRAQRRSRHPGPPPQEAPEAIPESANPYQGRFLEVMNELVRSNAKAALSSAVGWHEEDPGDVLALVAMGEVYEKMGDLGRAARAYGSIIDLFPARADLRRFAGARLERIEQGAGLELAADSFAKAAQQRPDHPASHRLLAFALIKKGEPARAFEALLAGLKQQYPSGRFAGVDQILREDLGLAAAAWIKKEPGRRAEILAKLRRAGGSIEGKPSIRFVLNWETDANDVDFHIYDARGGHAYYSDRRLPSGGELYADVTTGYGPECFTIRNPKGKRAGPYKLQAHYYSRGPMGYGMGKLQIIDHDGSGGLAFEERPFIVMTDGAFVDLGTVRQ